MGLRNSSTKILVFYIVMICIPCLTILGIVLLFKDLIITRIEPQVVEYVAMSLNAEERNQIKREITKRHRCGGGGALQTVPEHKVARLVRSHMTYQHHGDVHINNAGFRHTKPYMVKKQGIYRIICLGDSFVFGTAGKQEDRFCDQLEQWFTDNNVLIDGKKVETYAVGIESWTMLQEATYMGSRISNYDPDLIIVLTISNDITDPSAVTGEGLATGQYTDLHRERGSAVFTSNEFLKFSLNAGTVLNRGLTSESHVYWDEAVEAMKRLWLLQEKRGKKILFSVQTYSRTDILNSFSAHYRRYFVKHGINAPFMLVAYLQSSETKLPHDSHPNRLGHRLIRDQYLNAMAELKWLDVDRSRLPSLESTYKVNLGPALNKEVLERDEDSIIQNQLKTAIDFEHLKKDDIFGFLGGILPFREGKEALKKAPWSSIRSGFVLRREPSHRKLTIDIKTLPMPELYPMTLSLFVDGRKIRDYVYPSGKDAGNKRIEVPLEDTVEKANPLEVIIETDRYFTQINDHRMKSFRYLHAGLE